jgi:hypothetical protein
MGTTTEEQKAFQCEECGFETDIYVDLLKHDLESHVPASDEETTNGNMG